MARRMFSDEITSTDTFLDMPKGSQLLYFHIGMQADDDGFISNPKMVMRAIGSSDDELKLLFVKKFLLPFDSGICVVKHWRINNQIRQDRYTETKYTKEKAQLFIRENGSYSFNAEGAMPVPKGHFLSATAIKKELKIEDDFDVLPSGNQVATTRQPSIGKVSIGKESIEDSTVAADAPTPTPKKPTKVFVKPSLEDVVAYCKERNNAVNPQKWYNHYESNGWKVGRNPMKDWKAAVRTWEQNYYGGNNYQGQKPNNVLSTPHSKTLAEKMKEKASNNN